MAARRHCERTAGGGTAAERGEPLRGAIEVAPAEPGVAVVVAAVARPVIVIVRVVAALGVPAVTVLGEALAAVLGLTLVRQDRRIHTTPWGSTQPFTIAVLRP